MFLNGVLFNSEVWPELTATEITALESVDQNLLRSICQAHAKTPIEFIYLETGCVPLRYVISSRRLMYLHHIVHREDKELIKRVYDAQKTNPTKGDFADIVRNDLKLLGEDFSDELVKSMTKKELKTLIKDKMEEEVLDKMKEKQTIHKKVKDIKYEKLESQAYMRDGSMTNNMVRTLTALRSSMVRGVRANFVSSSVRTQCPLQCRDTACAHKFGQVKP